MMINPYMQGLKEGLPIGLGYLTVSVAFGLFAVQGGLSPLAATLVSASNLSSSGQFAGISLFFAQRSYLELALSMLLINLRYSLMSLSLAQRVPSDLSSSKRLIMGFSVTDEIFVCSMQHSEVGFAYFLGLSSLPLLGWTSGTALGAFLGAFLPPLLQRATGILLYAMFIAIVVPPAKAHKRILWVVVIASVLSCLFSLSPSLKGGWSMILASIIASGIVAYLEVKGGSHAL